MFPFRIFLKNKDQIQAFQAYRNLECVPQIIMRGGSHQADENDAQDKYSEMTENRGREECRTTGATGENLK